MNGNEEVIVGIDPGISGAIAIFRGRKLINVIDMPTYHIKENHKTKHKIDISSLRIIIQSHSPDVCKLERVASRPKQGITSAFNFGEGYGITKAIATLYCSKVILVNPSSWKKMFGLIGKNKQASIEKARSRIEGADKYLILKKHDGRAEAMLIALS